MTRQLRAVLGKLGRTSNLLMGKERGRHSSLLVVRLWCDRTVKRKRKIYVMSNKEADGKQN